MLTQVGQAVEQVAREGLEEFRMGVPSQGEVSRKTETRSVEVKVSSAGCQRPKSRSLRLRVQSLQQQRLEVM